MNNPSNNFRVLILFLMQLISVFCYSALFTNATGDELWTTPGNWNTGVVPDSLTDVNQSSGSILKVPNGYIAKCKRYDGGGQTIIQAGGTLKVFEGMWVYGGTLITNNGKIILVDNNLNGLHVTTGGQINNNLNDTILIYGSNTTGIDFRKGLIQNRGFIGIYNPSQIGVFMPIQSFPNPRQFINKPEGVIHISGAVTHGLEVSDTLTNNGIIQISNIVNSGIYPSGIWLRNYGKVFNNGSILIDDAHYGIENDEGTFTNESDGFIEISNYTYIGYWNKSITHQYGEMNIIATASSINGKGIFLENGTFYPYDGSVITVDGNNYLNTGIDLDRNITIDTGAIINVSGTRGQAIFSGGAFSGAIWNHGTINISDIPQFDIYTDGMDLYQIFNNYGTVNFTNVYKGFRCYDEIVHNYGDMNFLNVEHIALTIPRYFKNHTGASIHITSDDGSETLAGIFPTKDFPQDSFINEGNIIIDSVYYAIDFRNTILKNTGNILITNYHDGIEYGNFSDPALLLNYGYISLNNQRQTTFPAFNIESGIANIYNLINYSTGIIDINNAYTGFRVFSGGIKNEGEININNITDKCIDHTTNNTFYYHFKNTSTGNISLTNGGYGIYFGIVNNSSNKIPFINEGSVIFNNITNEAIDGNVNHLLFTNTGSIFGNAIFDCNFFNSTGNIHPGPSAIGAMQFNNFQSNNPTYNMQVKGNAGAGQPNGHDRIYFPNAISINGNLIVTTLSGFNPVLGNSYVIFLANGNITGTFTTVTLPTIGSDKEFELQYLPQSIRLNIIPKYKLWTGNVNTNWNNVGNWNDGIIPDSNAYVKIPDVTNNPTLGAGTFVVNNGSASANFRCKGLEIDAGGVITFNNTIVNNYGSIKIIGTLNHNDVNVGQIKNWGGSLVTVEPGGIISMSQ